MLAHGLITCGFEACANTPVLSPVPPSKRSRSSVPKKLRSQSITLEQALTVDCIENKKQLINLKKRGM